MNDVWNISKTFAKFLFPFTAKSKIFRAKFGKKLKAKEPIQYEHNRNHLWKKPWVIFAKKPFGNVKSVVEYLGRCTHKIAISNPRIKSFDNQM
ncbi:hypothetical protein E0F76_09470 [Flavobacterium cellulosilyticum]|uniref:Transposase IS801/IS1294 domain-containing protein n=1 Tax=Flavobacterium cellulosilyticum TaxID=2541731 RepID=A0A4V2YZK2_9FLAO|nr:hypothetical protein E0F76_09470 [Flavobacterium cellulosilyticum]